MNIQSLFKKEIIKKGNLIKSFDDVIDIENNQSQTKDIFSDKWEEVSKFDKLDATFEFQKKMVFRIIWIWDRRKFKNFP